MPRSRNEKTGKRELNRHFNPELKRSLGVILLLILSLLVVLSYFKMAGAMGFFIDSFLAIIFGQTRILAPLVIILIGLIIELKEENKSNLRHILGFIFLVLGVNGLIHLYYPETQTLILAKQGEAGGFLGYAASALRFLFGFWATLIILLGLVLASLLLILNTSLATILQKQKNLLIRLGTLGKIILGVAALFIKKTPNYNYYQNTFEEEPTESPNFAASQVKSQKSEELNPAPVKTKEKEGGEEFLGHPSLNKHSHTLPTFSLLRSVKSLPTAGDIKASQYNIQKTLQNFGIPVEMGEVQVGPTVTQYTLKPADGIRLAKIISLNNDLSLALAAHPIRIEAPIPGKSLVGVEVPNQKVALVTLKELLESKEFQNSRGALKIVLGKDVAGVPWMTDMAKLPHLLVAGATGSGKTIYLNALILSLLFQHTSETLRFIFVDRKRVELTLYNGIPHLLTPVITDSQKTINALRWTIGEMERRFDILSKTSQRNISEYNRVFEEKLPYIIFAIDELADLMAIAGAEAEASIVRLAQMARAVGIHLILATQRPSVDVITGLIKANFPARIAFSVASLMDSRTILDCSGAEKLLGRGDMLWSGSDMSKPKRLQGAYVSEEEIKQVVNFLKDESPPRYNDDLVNKQQSTLILNSRPFSNDNDDPLLDEAKKVITQADKASASLLQRRLKVGYARAARLLDLLEAQGVIGPADGAKPREVLIKTQGEVIIHEEDAANADSETNDIL